MATISNCGAKASLAPSIPDRFNPTQKTFPAAQWVTVLDWSGEMPDTVAFAVTVAGPSSPVVEWQRHESGVVVSSGSFQKAVHVVIPKGTSNVRFDVRVSDDQAQIDVKVAGSSLS